MKVFAIMLADIDDAYIDFSNAMLRFIDADLPLSMFGITPDILFIELPYTLKATYEKPSGKFGIGYTNSALIDCHDLFGSFIDSLKQNIEKFKTVNPAQYDSALKVLNDIEAKLESQGITFCDFAYDLNGVLKN